MYEFKNATFSFDKKSYIDDLLKKGRPKESASERVKSKNALQKGGIATQIVTQKNKLTTNQLCKYMTQQNVKSVSSNKQTMNLNQELIF